MESLTVELNLQKTFVVAMPTEAKQQQKPENATVMLPIATEINNKLPPRVMLNIVVFVYNKLFMTRFLISSILYSSVRKLS